MKSRNLFLFGLLFVLQFVATSAFAQDVDDITRDIVRSVDRLPFLIAAFAYMAGLIFAATGITKIVDHVTNPAQTPIRIPAIRFLIGGALFALPTVINAAITTINGGTAGNFDGGEEAMSYMAEILGAGSALIGFGTNVSGIFQSMVYAIDDVPGFIAALGYLLGTLIITSALFKTRDHVEDPTRVPLKDAVIRYLIGGALIALPTIYAAMYTMVAEDGLGVLGTVESAYIAANFLLSTQAVGDPLNLGVNTSTTPCLVAGFTSSKLDGVICSAMLNSLALPNLLGAVSNILGLIMGLWALVRIRDHVNDPSKVPLSDGVMKLVAGGLFFALPYLTVVALNTFNSTTGLILGAVDVALGSNSGFAGDLDGCSGTNNSLDVAMGCFVGNILGPTHVALNFFCFCAGLIFIMIGISRLIKSAQEGARGPGGMGTVGTFIVGSLLISINPILNAVAISMFGSEYGDTTAALASGTTAGMSSTEETAILNVISAVIRFMIIVGLLSFARGIFIMRDVAEGKQQASTMAGMTHIIGGALAVNLGPLLNAIQTTLGITAFGVSFS